MPDPVPTPEQQSLLKKARQAELLRIWVAAKRRLTRSELEEIADVIPAAALKRAPVQRTPYEKRIEDYEDIYGTKARAIKRWISIGRDAVPPDPPPLDQPAQMKNWWMKRMAHRVPDKLVALATRPAAPPVSVSSPSNEGAKTDTPAADASAGPLFAAAAVAAAAPSAPPVPPATASPAPQATGFLGALQRIRNAEAAAGELYTALVLQAKAPHLNAEDRARLAAEAEQQRRAWDELGDKLRLYEKDAEKILAATGRTWLSDDVLASLEVVNLLFRAGLENLLRRVRPKLKGCATPAEEDKLWSDETEKLFAQLVANKFAALPAPAVAA